MANEFRSGLRSGHQYRDRHPLQVVSAWAHAVAEGDTTDAMGLYATDARVHLGDRTLVTHRQIQGRLESMPMFASGRHPAVRGIGDAVIARWDGTGPPGDGLEVRCRVADGRITEQWMAEPATEPGVSTLEPASDALPVTATTRGDVGAEAVDYALQRLSQVTAHVHEPILAVSIVLSMAPDPARDRPALAQARLDVNGSLLGAHVAAHDMHEAVDLLVRRLADRLEHRAEKSGTLRRHSQSRSSPGEWRHADRPAVRPAFFDRPAEDRQLIRHKVFYAGEQTVDEAVFDMEQMDYEFYLFRDLDTGSDSLVERHPSGEYRLHQIGVADNPAGSAAVPELTVRAATDRLSATGDRFVFFADRPTGRGCVVYRRYDGHYGLITLE